MTQFLHIGGADAPSAKRNKTVFCNRRAASLYLASQYGVSYAAKTLGATKFAYGPIGYFATRREADVFAAKMRACIHYQQGRLGHPLNDGGISVA